MKKEILHILQNCTNVSDWNFARETILFNNICTVKEFCLIEQSGFIVKILGKDIIKNLNKLK